jgi:hypothetical protein
MEVIFKIVVVAGLVLAPAIVATNKGRGFWPWAIYGFFVWPIAIVHAFLLDGMNKPDTAANALQITPHAEPKRPWGRAGANEQ